MNWRDRILNLYQELGFSGDELAVLSALTVGYKEELSEEIKESYSISGASHILALSGLHIGFLYALLFFCLRILPDRWRGVALLRALLIIFLLWGFAFFTGLSPSVVRAVIMCSLLAIAGVFKRKSFSINTMAIAAFLMLLYQPAWLFDVGFQLSFCAVTAILLLQPPIFRLFPVQNRVGRYVWTLMSVSLAAQVGTAPLVLLYFSRFSTHFLLTNLLVIPLVSLVLYGAVVMLLLTPFLLLQSILVEAVQLLLRLLNASVRWVEQLPGSSVDDIWLYPLEVLLLYFIFWKLFRYSSSGRAKNLISALLGVFILLVFHGWMFFQDRPWQSLAFYRVYNCPVVHCIAPNGQSWMVCADSVPNERLLRRTLSNHWQRIRLEEPLFITEEYADSLLCYHNGIISFAGRRVSVIHDNRWRYLSASQPLLVDYLYLCKGYKGRLEELTRLFSFSMVVLDSSLPFYQQKMLIKECQQLGFSFISLSEKGSERFLL